jgi:tRNA modification GTPase
MAALSLPIKGVGQTDDTIFALSSGALPSAVAVIRISGPLAGEALRALIGRLPEARKAVLARVRDPETAESLDRALALWFPSPASETGEDMAEVQLHGGRAVVAAVFSALRKFEGMRLAEPGEFTRRAFEHGRLDLTRIEALADLIYAETEAQRRQAFRHMQGVLGDKAEGWRQTLVEAMALVEAAIDFPDEGDVPADLLQPALNIAARLCQEIEQTLATSIRGERLREGLTVAIAGPPNVGKSSLLNRIARREAAIVSSAPGTTRDIIEVHLDLEGFPLTLLDTAGIRDSSDPVEQEGIRRAQTRAARADLVLWVTEASIRIGEPDSSDLIGGKTLWLIANKCDVLSEAEVESLRDRTTTTGRPHFAISAKTGAGVEHLLGELASFARLYFKPSEPALVTRERQRQMLQQAEGALCRAVAEGAQGREEVVAEELRAASHALARLVGRVDVEDVLDAIFRDFCIGK